jgi:hypothetical protein
MEFTRKKHDHLAVCQSMLELLTTGQSAGYHKMKDELTKIVV